MELCRGFEDWLRCLKCSLICTRMCPLEAEDVVGEMRKRMHNTFNNDLEN